MTDAYELRKVYVARGPGDAQVLRGLLEAAGIRSVVRGDDFMPLQGGSLLHMEIRPSVWVLTDDQFDEAVAIVADYDELTAQPGTSAEGVWTCAGCGESIESAFTECWQCRRMRPSSSTEQEGRD